MWKSNKEHKWKGQRVIQSGWLKNNGDDLGKQMI